MLVACDQCHTRYSIDPQTVGAAGRNVRCTKCMHVWFYQPAPEDLEPEKSITPSQEAPPAEPAMPEPPIPAEVMPPKEEPAPVRDKKAEAIPSSVKPASDTPMPVVDYRPGGLDAAQFGLFTFLTLIFASFIALFLLRAPIARQWPAMTYLYAKLGFEMHVPGEGLQLSEMKADRNIMMMNISAKLTNISGKEMDYPKMKVIARGPYGASLKEWPIPATPLKLQPGQSTPVSVSLPDAPAEAKTVDLVVTE